MITLAYDNAWSSIFRNPAPLFFFATFWPCRFCVSKILISFVRILVCFFILTTQEVFHLSQE